MSNDNEKKPNIRKRQVSFISSLGESPTAKILNFLFEHHEYDYDIANIS